MPGKTRCARVRSVWYVLFGCSSEAPNHVHLTLVSTRPSACAPRKHGSDLTQVATLRHRSGGVASSGYVLQAHGSDVLLRHATHLRYRVVAAVRMLTVRSSADIRTNTAHGRNLGPPRGRSPRRVYVAAARMLTVRFSADTRTNAARRRYLGPPRGRSLRRVFGWQIRARKTKRHSVRKTNHQSFTTLFADRNQRLENVPPNAVHRPISYRMSSQEPR